jgi:MFS family permease
MRNCYGRGKPLRIAIYAACLSAFVFFGYDQGVLSGLLENEYFQEQLGSPVRWGYFAPDCWKRPANKHLSLHRSQALSCQAIVRTLISPTCHVTWLSNKTILTGLGSLIGCIINFAIGDWLGRRKMIWLAMGLIIVGAVLQTTAYTVSHLIVGRILTGFGTGIDSSTVPMYQSELCRKEWRGRIVSWEIWFIGELRLHCL